MAYSAVIKMVIEDDLPAITYQIKDENTAAVGEYLDARDSDTWAAVDLTDAVVTVDVREQGSDDVIETLPVTLIDIPSGLVMLIIASAEFPNTEGSYELETRVIRGGLQQTVYDMMLVRVRPRVKSLL